MRILLLTLSIFLSNLSYGEEAFLGYGLGIFHDADSFLGQNKYFELGYRSTLWSGIYWQYKGGYWGEGSSDLTRKAGFWVSSGPGVEISLDPVEVRSGWSLAAISTPDTQLGSSFPQFNGELYLGVRDKKGDGAGFQYEHISCASFCSPNHGRDFLIFELSHKW